jgi:hypothetical protein
MIRDALLLAARCFVTGVCVVAALLACLLVSALMLAAFRAALGAL